MVKRLATVAVAVFAGLASCDAERITGSNEVFTLETSISDASIGPGETATVTYRVRNVSPTPQTVNVGCNLHPYVKEMRGAFVHPPGGSWGCTGAITPVILGPGDGITRTMEVGSRTASAAGGSRVLLEPGVYIIYVEFRAAFPDVRVLHSPIVPFEITD